MATTMGPGDVVRAIIRARAEGDMDAALALIAPQSRDQGQTVSHTDWRQKWAHLMAAGLEVVTERTVENGEWVANLYRVHGAPGSDGAETRGMDMVRVLDGRLVEHWFFVEPDPA
ncbi:conserved hypothetical protein [Catenulispora acidiphila DSM 44928]|uniref:SnoaL-like domain-containing protein n=1 Tax=Catenulispora acidiphila (strain DSM 44928 / JCM 14897 / NBRC 102108 / NRRL B-24433 / ID139908) TaxID=479433 RepID=C7Q0Z0_CATAD|nr:nuclear transport factor 2 family protein [Catenulispora acidiphila]ACU71665.1 conserved hypothetical protein [Catenulispora acidiphila DSM 44928]